jgi:spermidine dehydrogenase
MLNKNISRRDFLNGTLLATGTALLPSSVLGANSPSVYPPLLNGMRGSNNASFKFAHALAMGGKKSFGRSEHLKEDYDLVVVGGGISGLSAAHFYQQLAGKNKKILILDNHDDFGGHARRNEFTIKGKTYLNYGGSQTLVEPSDFSRAARGLLKDLAVDIPAFDDYYDKGFYKKNGLSSATYFNKKTYGEDKVVKQMLPDFSDFIVGIKKPLGKYEDVIDQMPLSILGKEQLKKIIAGNPQQLPEGRKAVSRYLKKTSYPKFLKEQFGTDDSQVLHILRLISADDWGMGTDTLSAREALNAGAPGLNEKLLLSYLGKEAVESDPDDEPYIHHFPDGNASIARLLVRKLMPHVAPGKSAEDVVMSRFDYSKLDSAEASVRLRLRSTVIEVKHAGDPKVSSGVSLTYAHENKSYTIKAKNCVMACYNRMIPHLVPDLPQKQKEALKQQVKIPLVYSTVMLNNWRAFKELGIAAATCPGNMHHLVLADFPVSIGQRKFPTSVDEPMAVTMINTPLSQVPGLAPKEQFKEGRHRLLSTPYGVIENEILEHLNGMLGPAGFDAERDIHGITVNRWSHGYTYGGSDIHDPGMWGFTKAGRQSFGRIAIANSDSGGDAYAHIAIDQAWRAVNELI